MATYKTRLGGYPAALEFALKDGGQIYPGKSRDAAHTVVRGSLVTTFWEENSPLRKNVVNASRAYGFDPENMTAGRLCKHILRDIVGLDASSTFWGRKYRSLAMSGHHWHYQHCEAGYHPYLIEFDLKSAYMSSLFAGRSMFYHEVYGWQNDSGALEILRELMPSMPKWLRLTMLGVIASHKSTFYTIKSYGDGRVELKPTTIRRIDYGAAFNAVHGAILRTFRTMQEVHRIGGVHIKRMHTDSFAMALSIDPKAEEEIFEYLEKRGFLLSVKASGSSHFFNLNEGVIGKKLIGGKHEIEDRMREENIKIRREFVDFDAWKRYQGRVKELKLNQMTEEAKKQVTSYQQMHLPGQYFESGFDSQSTEDS